MVDLQDASLSVSAVWGRTITAGETSFGHVIDPRTGVPSQQALLTAVVLPCATEGDALTTALLVAPELAETVHPTRPAMRSLILSGERTALRVSAVGITPLKNFERPEHGT